MRVRVKHNAFESFISYSQMLENRVGTVASSNPCVIKHIERRIALGVEEHQCNYWIKRKKRMCRYLHARITLSLS